MSPFNFTQQPTATATSQAAAILQNLTAALSEPISPEQFDNFLPAFGSAQGSLTENQAFSMLSNLVGALGTGNIDPSRGEAIVDILASMQPSADTLASNGALLQNLAQGLTNNLPVGQPLVLGDPASGFALAVVKVDPAAQANLALSENSTLNIPPLAAALGGLEAPLHFAASGTDQPTYSIGISHNGTEITIRNLSTPFVMGFPAPAQLPNASQIIQCEYYDKETRRWLSDGCETTYDNSTAQTSCACNHLTEFAARFKALADVQAGVGKGIVDLFTKALSDKVIPILVFLLVMAGTTFLLIIWLNALDKDAIAGYSKMLELLPQLQAIRASMGFDQQGVWDRFLTKAFFSLPRGANARRVLRERALPRGSLVKKILEFWWRRLFHQHFYTSLLVRYDPAIPRVLRALFAMTAFFTSVAIVIFFYGYKNGSVGGEQLPAITPAETFVLSLMSSALTTPIITILRILMTKAGQWEYTVRYPELMTEMNRRRVFERTLTQLTPDEILTQSRPILQKLHNLPGSDSPASSDSETRPQRRSKSDSDSSRKTTPVAKRKPRRASVVMTGTATEAGQEIAAAAASVFTALDEGRGNADSAVEAIEANFIFQALGWLAGHCCSRKTTGLATKPTLQQLIRQVARATPPPGAQGDPCLPYRFFPVHTGKSWILVGTMLAWTAFTMIYILAFTSYESSDVAADVIRTVAISQAISNGVVAPVTQLSSIVIPYVLQRIKNALRAPKPAQTFGSPLVASLDAALSIRLPALASKHPCGTGDKKVDAILLPVSEIVEHLLTQPESEINLQAMTAVQELYMEVFHKHANIQTPKSSPTLKSAEPLPSAEQPTEINIDDVTITEERAYQDL